MKYKLFFTKKGRDDLTSIEKEDQKRIANKLRFYLASDKPFIHAKKIIDSRLGTYGFRIRNYRAIFDIDKKGNISILLILRIKHRKDAYLK